MYLPPMTLAEVPAAFIDLARLRWRTRGGRLTDTQIEYMTGATTAALTELLLLPAFANDPVAQEVGQGALNAIAILKHQIAVERGHNDK